jgi:hypothetical protein
MTQAHRLAAVLDASSARNSGLIGAAEQEALVVKLPAAHVVALSAVVLLGIASAAWWLWRFISLELTAAYAEGFRKAGMAEEQSHPGEPNRPIPKSEPIAHS